MANMEWQHVGECTTNSWTYDANNFIQSYARKVYNSIGTAITSGDSTHYYFHTAVGISATAAEEEGINIYPNPSSGTFQIEIGKGQKAIGNLEITNAMGEKFMSRKSHRQNPKST